MDLHKTNCPPSPIGPFLSLLSCYGICIVNLPPMSRGEVKVFWHFTASFLCLAFSSEHVARSLEHAYFPTSFVSCWFNPITMNSSLIQKRSGWFTPINRLKSIHHTQHNTVGIVYLCCLLYIEEDLASTLFCLERKYSTGLLYI